MRVFDEAAHPTTGEDVQAIEATEERLDELATLSRQLYYLLSLITKDSARLVVRANMSLNGLESWRLLARRFALPKTANNVSLLTKVLDFRFRTDHFDQDYTEWEQLKNRYKRQTATELPDSILVATLLNKTSGQLQQHLQLNAQTLDAYEAVRQVIKDYSQLRHVVKGNNSGVTGPWRAMYRKRKGKGKGSGKWSPLKLKGKGRGK